MKRYQIRLLQALSPQDHNLRRHFCINLRARLEEDGLVLELIFSDEATLHVSGKFNRHNLRIFGFEKSSFYGGTSP